MIDTTQYTHRFEKALDDLAVTFTDLILLVEGLDRQLEQHDHRLAAQADELAYLKQQIAALEARLP